MYNDLFTIGKFTLHGYGLMIGLGFIFGLLVGLHIAKQRGIEQNDVIDLALLVFILGFAGGKLLYIITDLPDIISGKYTWRDLSNGFVVYGGIIMALIVALIFCRKKKIDYGAMGDVIATSTALVQGFGRIGCFLAGCCYGMETKSWFHVTFTHSDYAPNNVPLIPTQLISSAANFLNFAVLMVAMKKCKKPGQVFALYLINYRIGRFIIEFFRGDLIRGQVGVLSTSQFISIFILAFGIWFYFYNTKRKAEIKKAAE